MKQRLGFVLVLALASASVGMSACSGDDTGDDDDTGGSAGAAGSHAGTKTGGTSSSGSSNKAGTDSGGQAGDGSGGTPEQGGEAGNGGVPGGGTAGAGGNGGADGGVGGVVDGGTGGTAGAAGDAGAAGAAGAGGAPLVYACGSNNAYQKVCSAKAAANCNNEIVCAECVPQTADEHDGALVGCQACDDFVDAFYQCAIDAFETGDTVAGMQCFGDDADFSDQCYEIFNEYNSCTSYILDHDCPATWPLQ